MTATEKAQVITETAIETINSPDTSVTTAEKITEGAYAMLKEIFSINGMESDFYETCIDCISRALINKKYL